MKKFLLTLAAVIGLGSWAAAETYTFTAAEMFASYTATGDISKWTAGGFTFEALKNAGNTTPSYNFKGQEVRLYAKNTLNIKANGANITAIDFTLSAQGLQRQTAITPSVGTIDQALSQEVLKWAGSSADLTFTVGNDATLGTDSVNTKTGKYNAGQFDWLKIVITTDGEVGDVDPIIPGGGDEPEGDMAEYEKATTMAAGSYVIYAENFVAVPLDKSMKYGYIQTAAATPEGTTITTAKANAFEFVAVEGGYNIKDSFGRYVYQTGSFNSFNVSASFVDTIPAAAYVWAVEVADGAFKIKNTSVEKTIQYDAEYKSFGSYDVEKGVFPTLYKYSKDVEGGQTPAYTSVTALSQIYSLKDADKITVDVDLTAVYVNGSYVYVYDGTSYALIYKSNLGVEAGKVINKGWKAEVDIYKNLVELKPEDAKLATGADATVPQPLFVEADEASTILIAANQNTYVHLSRVTFAEATPAADAASDAREFVGKMDETEVSFYQRFGVESVAAGEHDVVGFISVYDKKVQVYVTEFLAAGGIDAVEADVNAPVEYYNIQGVKIANPRQGSMYIRVQGGNATKVVF